MVQLKLTLKSKRPSTVYSANGKSYRLLPGSNVLNLEYEDYLALAKSLSIKPVQKEEPVKEEPVKEEPHEEPVKEESREEDLVKEEIPEEPHEEPVKEESVEESHEEIPEEHHEEPVKEEQAEESHEEQEESIEESHEEQEESHSDDYSSWSYSELKAEYKNITGKSCKLRKEEIIKFLQENKDNVE